MRRVNDTDNCGRTKSVPNCWPDKSRYPAYKLKARNNIAHNGCLLFLAFVVLNLNYYIL